MAEVLYLPNGEAISVPRSGEPYPDTDALVALLKSDIWLRWMRKAQKLAFQEWRDMREWPGLAARFAQKNVGKMGLGDAKRFKGKKDQPFHRSGKLMRQVLMREPKSKTASKVKAVTRFSYGGGALNFLSSIYPTIGYSTITEQVKVSIPGSTTKPHTRTSGGTRQNVKGYNRKAYSAMMPVKKKEPIKGSKSYADIYGNVIEATKWIAKRIEYHFLNIVRKAALTKKGKMKVSFYSRYLSRDEPAGAGGVPLPGAA